MEKYTKILQEFLDQVQASPAQRTPEWYAIRKGTIGGSEVATVIGLNPYNKVKDLIAGKIGLSRGIL